MANHVYVIRPLFAGSVDDAKKMRKILLLSLKGVTPNIAEKDSSYEVSVEAEAMKQVLEKTLARFCHEQGRIEVKKTINGFGVPEEVHLGALYDLMKQRGEVTGSVPAPASVIGGTQPSQGDPTLAALTAGAQAAAAGASTATGLLPDAASFPTCKILSWPSAPLPFEGLMNTPDKGLMPGSDLIKLTRLLGGSMGSPGPARTLRKSGHKNRAVVKLGSDLARGYAVVYDKSLVPPRYVVFALDSDGHQTKVIEGSDVDTCVRAIQTYETMGASGPSKNVTLPPGAMAAAGGPAAGGTAPSTPGVNDTVQEAITAMGVTVPPPPGAEVGRCYVRLDGANTGPGTRWYVLSAIVGGSAVLVSGPIGEEPDSTYVLSMADLAKLQAEDVVLPQHNTIESLTVVSLHVDEQAPVQAGAATPVVGIVLTSTEPVEVPADSAV